MEYKIEPQNVEQGMSNDEVVSEKRSFIVNDPSRTYDLEDRLIAFAVLVCQIAERLPTTRVGNHVANQLIRSGTSSAPNYGEAQSAESRRDFIHKLKVCLKELRETHVWLKFIRRMNLDRSDALGQVINEANELIAIFVRSVETVRKKSQR